MPEGSAALELLIHGGVVGVLADIAEQFDGQFQLLAVDRVGAVGEIVGEPAQHVDVVVGDLDAQ